MADKPVLTRVAETASEGIAEAHPRGAAGGGSAEDADLFGFELEAFAEATIKPAKRGPGRPAGSINRTTLQLQRVLMMRGYRDPAEFQAAIMSMDTDELAKKLECKPLEALTIQLRASEGLMPYFHQKMPTAVELKGDAPRRLIVMGDVVQNVQHNQTLSVEAPRGSHGKGSHDGG